MIVAPTFTPKSQAKVITIDPVMGRQDCIDKYIGGNVPSCLDYDTVVESPVVVQDSHGRIEVAVCYWI